MNAVDSWDGAKTECGEAESATFPSEASGVEFALFDRQIYVEVQDSVQYHIYSEHTTVSLSSALLSLLWTRYAFPGPVNELLLS